MMLPMAWDRVFAMPAPQMAPLPGPFRPGFGTAVGARYSRLVRLLSVVFKELMLLLRLLNVVALLLLIDWMALIG